MAKKILKLIYIFKNTHTLSNHQKNSFTVKCCRCVWKSIKVQIIVNLDYNLDPDILGHNDNIVCPSSLMDKGKNSCLQTFGCILYKDSFSPLHVNKKKSILIFNIFTLCFNEISLHVFQCHIYVLYPPPLCQIKQNKTTQNTTNKQYTTNTPNTPLPPIEKNPKTKQKEIQKQQTNKQNPQKN